MRGRQRTGQHAEEPPPLGRRSPRPASRKARVPEPQLVARGAVLADRAQEPVALLEDPPVRRERVAVGRRARRGQLIDHGATERRRARDQEHLLGGEDDHPEQPGEARGSPARGRSPGSACARRTRSPRRERSRPRGYRVPTAPSIRARSVPQRISSPSALVRCDRPQASSTIASSRLVLPAAFGPQTGAARGRRRPRATA